MNTHLPLELLISAWNPGVAETYLGDSSMKVKIMLAKKVLYNSYFQEQVQQVITGPIENLPKMIYSEDEFVNERFLSNNTYKSRINKLIKERLQEC